jgi:hypothetical protein
LSRRVLGAALAAAFALVLVFAGSASARYFINRAEAIHYMRDYLHYDRGYPHTQAYCRPQFENDAQPGYIYHSWLCAWRGLDYDYSGLCRGLTLIKGSSNPGHYWKRALWKRGNCY